MTAPYFSHNYMREHADDATVLAFIRSKKFDSASDGTGNPTNGMIYYNTTVHAMKTYANGTWTIPGNVVGPSASVDNEIPRYSGVTGKLLKNKVSPVTLDDNNDMAGLRHLNMTGNISVSGTVDGRDISADWTTISNHISSGANPHGVTAAQVGNTFALWNANKLQGRDIWSNVPGTGALLAYDGVTYNRWNFTLASATNGQLAYWDSTNKYWSYLSQGANGQYLKSSGGGNPPSWASIPVSGDVFGPASSTAFAVARYSDTTGKVLLNSGVTLDNSNNLAGINNITVSGTVDGRDISSDWTTTSNHISSSSNPHSVTRAQIGAGDVNGPASAVDSRLALFDGGTGKLIKNSGATYDNATGYMTGVYQINAVTTGTAQFKNTSGPVRFGSDVGKFDLFGNDTSFIQVAGASKGLIAETLSDDSYVYVRNNFLNGRVYIYAPHASGAVEMRGGEVYTSRTATVTNVSERLLFGSVAAPSGKLQLIFGPNVPTGGDAVAALNGSLFSRIAGDYGLYQLQTGVWVKIA